MKGPWKTILTTTRAGQMPDVASCQAFVEDSRLMISYPGKGDEFYAAYAQELEVFVAALDAGDAAALAQSAEALQRIKEDCHARYK